LFEKIVGESDGRSQTFPAGRRPILRQRVRGGEDKVGLCDEILEGVEFGSVGWHNFMVRPNGAKSKR
jgi:hypothetical protein